MAEVEAKETMSGPFGMRERDGVLETLLFFARQRLPGKGDRYYRYDWHILNLETGEISQNLGTMPLETRFGTSAVFWLNCVYVLGGFCKRDPSCPDGKITTDHFHDHVFCFDSDQPDPVWKVVPHMLVPRWMPAAVAAKGKIYVFVGDVSNHFAEVFDVSVSSWQFLSPPSDLDFDPRDICVSSPVFFDSPRSRILVKFYDGPLYAYHVDDDSWECLDETFGRWPSAAVLVDNVLYYLLDHGYVSSWLLSKDDRCSLKAYDVVENKMLPVKWFSEFPLRMPSCSRLFHLGNDQFCLAFYSDVEEAFEWSKISLCNKSGEIHATRVSESQIKAPFESCGCDIFCPK